MKLAKLSLAAIAVVGLTTSSFAADTLADAFKNGKVKGEIKAYYDNKDTGTADADVFATGLMLNYVTDSFSGFTFGATFQSSSTPFIDKDGKKMFINDMDASGAQLSEVYLAYTMAKTTVKVGRQYISTPILAGSGSRLVKQSWEGVTVVNTDLPNTTLVAGYVDKYQDRTDRANGGIGEFNQVSTDGEYTILAINKSIPGLALTAQYLKVDDDTPASEFDMYYGEAMYNGKSDTFSYLVGVQYANSEVGTAGADNGTILAAKVGVGMGGLNAYVAYSTTGDDAKPKLGQGSGSSGTYYTKSYIGSSAGIADEANYDAWAIDVNYAIAGALVGARYIDIDQDGADGERVNVYAKYAMKDGALKGMNFETVYEGSEDGTAETDQYWVRAVYKF